MLYHIYEERCKNEICIWRNSKKGVFLSKVKFSARIAAGILILVDPGSIGLRVKCLVYFMEVAVEVTTV